MSSILGSGATLSHRVHWSWQSRTVKWPRWFCTVVMVTFPCCSLVGIVPNPANMSAQCRRANIWLGELFTVLIGSNQLSLCDYCASFQPKSTWAFSMNESRTGFWRDLHRLIESDQINSLSTIRHAKLSFSVADGAISKRFIRRWHLKEEEVNNRTKKRFGCYNGRRRETRATQFKFHLKSEKKNDAN